MAEGGSTSSTNSGRANDQREIPLPFTIWIDSDEESEAEGSNPFNIIPKVPFSMIINENLTKGVPNWSEPSMIPIGPYHFRDFYHAQKLKTKHAKKFIKESKQKIGDLCRMIDESTPELKKWYDSTTNIIDEDLTTIFLVDGCFLLNFINYSNEEDGFTKLGLTNREMVNIKRDLFLLENQLPYAFLQLLLSRADPNYKNGMEEKIRRFVASYAPTSPLEIRVQQGKNCNSPIHLQGPASSNAGQQHLLHRLQGILLRPPQAEQVEQQGENSNSPCHLQLLNRLQGILFHEPESSNSPQEHEPGQLEQQRGGGRTAHWRSCRTVQELRKVGVSFKPSATGYFSDISFKPGGFGAVGCLHLPTITLNTLTMTTFLNLIAFEASNSSGAIELGVISYLCFMDSLIDSEDDVKELQAAGILHNSIGGTKEVTHFFNTVCSNVMPHPSYRNVIQEIENHLNGQGYKSRWRKWYVELKQQYFSSPWSCISLLAAILLLCLTAIQAFASLYPRQSGK